MIHQIREYSRTVGIRGLIAAMKGKVTGTPGLLRITRPETKHPFYLRTPSTDVFTFSQIFIAREYDFGVRREPKTIVDAGANIGLATICFASRFPGSRIVAVEPEAGNFRLLEKNCAPYPNITPVLGALWHENTTVRLVDPGRGAWGFMTQRAGDGGERFGATLQEVEGMTVDSIMRRHGIEHIDVLKIDIEGAEREVFRDPSSWIDRVDSLIVELHERFMPGCNRSFYCATNGFDDEWVQGENVYLTRNAGPLTRRREP